jgi:hypothetical protein
LRLVFKRLMAQTNRWAHPTLHYGRPESAISISQVHHQSKPGSMPRTEAYRRGHQPLRIRSGGQPGHRLDYP